MRLVSLFLYRPLKWHHLATSQMAPPSRLQTWLRKFPVEERESIERRVQLAPTITRAYEELKGLGYKGSYDSVQSWRANNSKRKGDSVGRQAKAYEQAANSALEDDPVQAAVNLSKQLNQLCVGLADLLRGHDWLEGEERLSNRDAVKILGLLAPLSRASVGSLLELSQIKSKIDERVFALGLVEELSQDWQKVLQHDNPELIPLFAKVADVTMARLEIDRSNLLENYLNQQQEAVEDDLTQV